MKNSYLVIAFLLIACISHISCIKRDCERTESQVYFYIDTASLTKIPFRIKETLVYISDQGDTAVLTCNVPHYFRAEKMTANTNCDQITHHYETMSFQYYGKHPELYYFMFQVFAGTKETMCRTQFNSGPESFYGSEFKSFNDESRYITSIVINGKNYTGISSGTASVDYLYNYNFGFLQILINNKTWTLDLKP